MTIKCKANTKFLRKKIEVPNNFNYYLKGINENLPQEEIDKYNAINGDDIVIREVQMYVLL